ncbi:MAG: PolC-type DNA polymerase III [Bacilli bacterium]
MDNKLKLLLEHINLDEIKYQYFEKGTITKIVASKNKESYNFELELENVLPLNIYNEFMQLLKTYYKDLKNISATITSRNKNNQLLPIYYRNLMEKYSKQSPLISLFKDYKIISDENNLIIEIHNKAEQLKFETITEHLEKDLKTVGFDLNIKTLINQDESNEIYESINQELKVVAPPVSIKEDIKEETKKRFVPKDYKRPPLLIDKDNENVIVGKFIEEKPIRMDTIVSGMGTVVLEVKVFGKDIRNTKTDLKIMSLKLTDTTDSIYGTIFINDQDEFNIINDKIKEGNWYKIKAQIKEPNQYTNEISLTLKDINILIKEEIKIIDDAPKKRVELHTHTKMSQMDGVVNAKDLVKQAYNWGHRAISITDHNGAQSFPEVYRFICDVNKNVEDSKEPFKAIYGTELTMVDDTIKIVVRPNDSILIDNTYVVFDLETTGFNAGGGDKIIEIGAVKIHNGEIIDKLDILINPGKKLSQKIIEVTSITDEMLEDKPDEETGVKEFIDWMKNYPMVAHNAKFDVSFIEMAYQKYNLGTFTNTVIDTLELSRTMDNTFARHSLSALVKRYDIPFDENSHHRGDYDAEATALIFNKMIRKLNDRNIETVNQLDNLVSKDEIHKYGRTFHVNLLAKNKIGLKNLFKIISLANTTYLYKTPRILRSEISKLREGIIIGSGCYESEVFVEARSKSDEELTNIINFYDYVEVQPIDVYNHLLQMGDFASEEDLIENVKKIIRVTEAAGKIVVATGDVHHLKKDDKIYREIIVNQKVPGGGRHPLARNNIKNIPSQHFRTTREMLDNFSFLGDKKAYEIVVENTNTIADMVDILEVIIETGGVPFSPRVKDDDGTYIDCPRVVTDLVYEKAASWYGQNLPFTIEERIAKELYGDIVYNSIKSNLEKLKIEEQALEKESFKQLHETILKGFDEVKKLVKQNIIDNTEESLTEEELNKKLKKSLGGIIGGGFDPIYLIAQRLVKKSNDDGFLVGSRGSVGSSFVATMMGITEVNPLPAHYRCPICQHSIFEEDGKVLGAIYSSGFDLPNKICPNCKKEMIKDGQDMPFATFLGFNADKVPDIDLNFSDLNQGETHEYTKVLFGVDNVFRAGTIGTVADKTAFGFVKGYCEERSIVMRTAEVERLAMGCTGVKRTTGQHPGGIVVIPDYMEVSDFTPFQYPADDVNSAWRTTHFDYHSIEDDVLKLDILGHSDPTQLRMIQDLTGMDVTTVPLDDKETMGIFLSPEPLGVTKDQIMCETGTLGIPEFGTKFTLQMLTDTKPTTFAELVKISGLSHGTDVWLGNAQELIKNKIVPFSEVIGCRDDIMVYLMYKGLKPITAFKIMEFVRKGRASKPKDKELWLEYEQIMRDSKIEEWFIESCFKIKYMFPKAHAAAYVISAFRIAWYKVHMPVYYYASWLSSKANDFNVDAMINGYSKIKEALIEINNKGFEATNKDAGIYESLHLCLEATARGIKFLNVNLYKSNSTTFSVKSETEIYPPFSSIDGLGDTVANNIVEERNIREFLSIEDFQKRCKVSSTLIEKMRMMKMFDGMDESCQLSLF